MLELLKNKRILVVVAHPDDELLGLGGTLNKIVKDYNQNYHQILFLNEYMTANFFALFFHSFTDKMYFDHKYAQLVL